MSFAPEFEWDRIAIIEFDEVDSTNSEALRRAATGEAGPLCVVARRQSSGRGRAGRSWTMADGNLAASFLFQPDCPDACLPQLSLVAGLAVHDAIASLPLSDDFRLRLKWPNDLMVGQAKLGGILVESTTFDQARVAVIGVGLNISAAPVVPGRQTIALDDICLNVVSPRELLHAIAEHIGRRLGQWAGGRGFAQIREDWLRGAWTDGDQILVNAHEGPVTGRFAGLDETGALLIDTGSGQIKRITSGEVNDVPGIENEDCNGR